MSGGKTKEELQLLRSTVISNKIVVDALLHTLARSCCRAADGLVTK